jgi:hypothetical protein
LLVRVSLWPPCSLLLFRVSMSPQLASFAPDRS